MKERQQPEFKISAATFPSDSITVGMPVSPQATTGKAKQNWTNRNEPEIVSWVTVRNMAHFLQEA